MTYYYVDGFTIESNPSKTGGGYTIFKDFNFLKSEEIRKEGFTNNEAELLAVLEATRIASSNNIIFTDSLNTIKWIKSADKFLLTAARKDLDSAKKEAFNLIREKKLKLCFCPREQNLAGIYNENNK